MKKASRRRRPEQAVLVTEREILQARREAREQIAGDVLSGLAPEDGQARAGAMLERSRHSIANLRKKVPLYMEMANRVVVEEDRDWALKEFRRGHLKRLMMWLEYAAHALMRKTRRARGSRPVWVQPPPVMSRDKTRIWVRARMAELDEL